MTSIALMLILIVFTWGWVILGISGIVILAMVRDASHQVRRIIVASCILLAAVFWARLAQPLILGVDYQTIRTQADETTATVRKVGFSHFCLVLRKEGKEPYELLLPKGQVERIFWIEEGKTIGISNKNHHMIVDIEILFDQTINDRDISLEEKRRLNFERTLTPEEEKLFEAAELNSTFALFQGGR
jgi:hypothetical protein